MEVYRRALGFIRTANSVREDIVSRRVGLADELDRAAVSVTLNIAEGAGEFAKREKTHPPERAFGLTTPTWRIDTTLYRIRNRFRA
jgi:four helix bundle protein